MAFHELATNALKYGSLSNPGGTVSLSWKLPRGPEGELETEWREAGGPAVTAPSAGGFGSFVVKGLIESQLGASVQLDFVADGLYWRAVMPARTQAVDPE